MQDWSRDPISSRLVRNTPHIPAPPPEFTLVMVNHLSLQDKFYPIRTSLPSCIRLPEVNGNNLELKPQFINTLPRFHSLESEDAYFFTREFEEECLMMSIPQLGEDTVWLRFISFTLKNLTKKWFYSLALDSILTWDNFVKVFLKKSTPFIKSLWFERITCSLNMSTMNRSESTLSALKTYLPSVTTMA